VSPYQIAANGSEVFFTDNTWVGRGFSRLTKKSSSRFTKHSSQVAMEKQLMLDEIKEFFQSFLAPQLEGIRGDIRALDSKLEANIQMLDARIQSVDTKVESYRREFLSELRRVEEKMDARLGGMDHRLDSLDQNLDSFHRELLAEIRAAVK
jgi:t-SNARE complex subunit (syntaxin)